MAGANAGCISAANGWCTISREVTFTTLLLAIPIRPVLMEMVTAHHARPQPRPAVSPKSKPTRAPEGIDSVAGRGEGKRAAAGCRLSAHSFLHQGSERSGSVFQHSASNSPAVSGLTRAVGRAVCIRGPLSQECGRNRRALDRGRDRSSRDAAGRLAVRISQRYGSR